ncbi:OmpA family protein [Gimesia sp.]|uniref:OmpA family protein n=1 Tax=Gimesia sp. TaxID=2024833 RepID=UPI000C494754|nr:OmpA family protein [Gimesia sp.]MAX37730.1 flagellar motor protein MotB [Gimesia sp.]HAH43679.1 flagellar motor protein MotB [Planctomycetaceae bacterium]HBL46172.1 flagellar motor protein MotB [Planctomycetaceae bacterium]
MPILVRVCLLTAVSLFTISQSGCQRGPNAQLRQSMYRSQQLYDQNSELAMQRDQFQQSANALQHERDQLAMRAQSLESNLSIANKRLDNLNSERSEMQQRYVSLMKKAKGQPSPLDGEATRRFQELADKYPDFEFDPHTGVSKFHSDILFSSGSDNLKPAAQEILNQFAAIMNDGNAKRLNVLVVGHTDDKPISKASTQRQHRTNWHLSTNRANSVVLTLSKFGVKQERMGSAGYSMFQPVVPNQNDSARQKNRRVEIFVLAPDAVVAGWDPNPTLLN